MLVIVQSGLANLASVARAVERLGVEVVVSDEAATIRKADRVILPGVGAAAPAMAGLRALGLDDVVRGLTQPVLGICLGMQLLFSSSTEGGGVVPCLGVIEGAVDLLKTDVDQPVPHMGWNQLRVENAAHPLLRGVADGDFV